MANSGSFNTNGYEGRCLNFSWSLKSQSIANNTSTISWTLKGAGGNSSYWYEAGNFKVVVDGTQRYASSTRIRLWNGTVVASGEVTMTHNSNGSRSFSASAEAGIYTYAVNCRGSASWSLPTIPRQASIQSAPDFNDTDNPTITYSNPAGTAVASLQACIANSAGTVIYAQYRDISMSGTSYTFNLTDAERNALRQACANSKTLAVKFYVTTVIGGNTYYSTLDRTMTVVDANPTFSASYQDTNSDTTTITQNNQLIIRNQSKLRINLSNAAAYKYATLSSVSCVINGLTFTGSISGTTGTINVGILNVSSNATAAVTLTDSRGYTTTQNLTIQVLDWTLPTAIISAKRQNHFYTPTTLTVDGSYSSLDGKNEMTIQYRTEPLSSQITQSIFDFADHLDPSTYSLTGFDVAVNEDGSLTAYGCYEAATLRPYIIISEDITDLLVDGKTYTLSQTTASVNFCVNVTALESGGSDGETYSCDSDSSVSFTVDKSTYTQYGIQVVVYPTGYARYEEWTFTEAFSLVEDEQAGWSAWQTISDNVPTVIDLNNQYAWTVQVKVSDKIGSTTYNITVPRGMPIQFWDVNKSSVGFNCFPQGEQTVEVNGTNIEARSVMSKSLTSNLSGLAVNTYTKISLNSTNSVGSKLIATADGGIKIGAGVKKILVSGRILISTDVAGSYYIRICANSTNTTLAWVTHTNQSTSATFESIDVTPILVDVNEGDVIYMYYYSPTATATIYGTTFGSQTSMTVETAG